MLKGLRHWVPKDRWLRQGLVIAQFAVSIILIACTLVVDQQMDLVRSKYLGFDRDRIVVVKIFGADAEQIHLNGQYNAVKQRFLRHPNIIAAGARLKYLHLKIKPDRMGETMAFIKKTWTDFIPTRPLECFFLDEYIDSKYRREQRQGRLFTRSALVAIVLACLGLAGLAAFAAEQRAREKGYKTMDNLTVIWHTIENLRMRFKFKCVEIQQKFMITLPAN